MSAMEAVETNDLSALRDLVKMNSLELQRTDNRGRTLMAVACEHGLVDIVKYLAEQDDGLISKENNLGYNPVHVCARHNHLDSLRVLYDYGASLQSRTDDEGYTALHLAASAGHMDTVVWLCEHKVKANIIDNSSQTAADLAKQNGHTHIVDYLNSI
jgi:ankyrin repeat protein